jgi:hypothetical protein
MSSERLSNASKENLLGIQLFGNKVIQKSNEKYFFIKRSDKIQLKIRLIKTILNSCICISAKKYK